MISHKKNWAKILVIGILFLALAFVAWNQLQSHQAYLKPKIGDVVESIYGLGTVTASKVFHLRIGVALTVQKLFVQEGDLVKPGQYLVQFDETRMKSPIEGTITNVNYKEGELVSPLVSAITVTNLKSLYLEISLEQQSIMRITNRQSVVVSFESLRSEKYNGVVHSIYPRDNQFIIRIELEQWPEGVLPGMTADAAILVGKKTNVLLIPMKTLVAGQVTRIRDGKKERIPVKLGVIDGEWAEVISDNIVETDELISRK